MAMNIENKRNALFLSRFLNRLQENRGATSDTATETTQN